MAFFITASKLNDKDFERLTGVKRPTFDIMITGLRKAESLKYRRGGRNSKLCLEDKLLMTLEYWREYRTIFHISQSYGIAESNAGNTIRWVEDVLSEMDEFKLPGKKALRTEELEYEVFLIDATETPIERPKKKEVQKSKK
jgi:hypothetical protein